MKKEKQVSVPPEFEISNASDIKQGGRPWKIIVGVLAVLFLALLVANKGWIVSAMVNGKPIYSWELNNTLRARYGQQTLEGMIGETLIADEAKKAGVTVTDSDLKNKQQEVLNSLGANVQLDDFLKFQGMTKDDFNKQLKVQIMVERMLTKDLKISDSDITNYIATNGATLTATDPAKLKEEARQAIVNNKVSEKLQTWFTNMRAKASVVTFL